MIRRNRLAAIALAAIAPLVVASCGSSTGAADGSETTPSPETSASSSSDSQDATEPADDSGRALNVIVVTPYLGNATTKEAIDDLQAEAESRGWNVSVVDTAGDMNQLNSAFQNAAAEKPDAIVMGAGDPTQVSLGLKAAADAGVPVFAFDAGVTDGILANVTSDNASLGQMSATELVSLIGGQGSIVMFTHEPHPGVRARAEGARKVFDEEGIEVLESKHVNVPGPVDDARTSMQDMISALGDKIDGVWGGWDEPALGATQALDAAGMTDIPVVGVDGQDFALAEIRKGGPFKATVSQDWKAITAKVVDLIQAKAIDGVDPDQQQYELPGQLITADDLG